MKECKWIDCSKEALDGYGYCEDHVGQVIKREQEQKKKDAEYFENYANCYDYDD